MVPPSQTTPAPTVLKQLGPHQVKLLEQQGFTRGLIHAMSHYVNTIPLRIWVIDNSSSMQVRDGHRVSGSTFQEQITIDCTRWDEAQDEVAFHAYSAGSLGLPTRFNLVNTTANSPSCFSVGEQGPVAVQSDLARAKTIMCHIQPTSPANPLANHIRKIRAMLVLMAPQLRQEGKFVSVLVATAGLPTDLQGIKTPGVLHDFVQVLRSLEGLPVSVVVRLCTDDEPVLDFYNSLDVQLSSTGLSYDVIDDFHGEAVEVYLRNPWLNYALPLHRFRQYGFNIEAFNELDERALTFAELYSLCFILFGTLPPHHQPLPDPAANWLIFLRSLNRVVLRERLHFNPITKTLSPWIDLRQLHFVYGGRLPFPPDLNNVPYGTQFQNQHQPQRYPSQPQAQYGQQQQKQQQPPPAQTKPSASISARTYAQETSEGESLTKVKRGICAWATAAPTHQHLRRIDEMLGSVPQTFPPAFGVADHAYFKKWKPFAQSALQGRDEVVLKRALRKTKFFLHPDKLPKDLTKEQAFLCKMLWDTVADAWEAFGDNQSVTSLYPVL